MAATAPEPAPSSRRLVTLGVLTGTALAALEATVVGAAMPTVIASVGGLHHYSWVFSAYLVTSTVSVPVWGKLSDLYGRRRLYQLGVAFFLVGSALSGSARTMPQLVAYRALQGLGAGALVPLGLTILADLYGLAERARVQALFSGVWGLASVMGPPVGGFITEQLSWRWVFYLNIPFGLAAALILGAALREARPAGRPRIDYAGAALLTAALGVLMLALADVRTPPALLAPWRVGALAGAAALAAAFVRTERRAADPVVPPALLRRRTVAVAVAAGFLTGAAMFGAISFVPLYAQGVLGDGATGAGAALMPLMLAWVTFSVLGGRLLLRIGYRPTVVAGLGLLTVGFVMLGLHDPRSARLVLHGELAMVGAGLGLTMLTLLLAVQQSVPRAQLGLATSVNQLSRSVGGAVGVAVMGVLLSAGLASSSGHGADVAALVVPGGAASPSVERDAVRSALAGALSRVFLLAALQSGLALLVVLAWLPGGGAPSEEECCPDTGERMVAAEMATLDPGHEPEAVPLATEKDAPRDGASAAK
jgi:EmrB/QacA subfamily drug resistance transporter